MGEQSPATLEVGFEINPGAGFSQLEQLDALIGKSAADAVREFAKMEQASRGAVNLGPATASVRAFGSAATRGLQDSAVNLSKVERAGEMLVRQIERQIDAFGKSRAELLQQKVALTAADLETVKLGGHAEDLRGKLATLSGMQNAAAAAAESEAAAMRSAAQAYSLFEAAAARGMVLLKEQEALARSQAMEAQAAQVREAAFAYQMFEAAARKGVAAMKEQQAAEAAAATEAERMAAAADRLRMSVDPAFAAQRRFDDEMSRAKQLISTGAISLDDYCAKLRIEKIALDQSTAAHRNVGAAQRFTAAETLNLSRQFQDIGVTAAMGMNPLMILVQQGPQIYDVLEQAKIRGVGAASALKQMGLDAVNYGAAGLSKLAAFATPANALLAATAVATVAVIRTLGSYDVAMTRFEATAAGVGRVSGQTAAQLEAISEAAATSGQRWLGSTRDSVNAFASAGIQGSQTLTLLAANVEKYAKLTGQDVPAAQSALAEAMKDPARAADTFTQSLGLLTGAQYEHIKQLAAAGDQEQATAELTRILTRDLAANTAQTTGLAHYMDLLGGAVSGVANVFGRLDQKIKAAGATYDSWLKRNVGGWAVDLLGTGNKAAPAPNPNAGRNQDQVAALGASQTLNTAGMKQYNDLLAQQRVLQKGLADTTGLTSVQVQALRHDYAAVTDTINANRTASGQWITTQERAHLIAQAQAKLAAARTQTEKATAQQQITRLQLGTQVLTQQERQTQALDAYNKVADKYVKPKVDHHADTLARDAEAMEAQIRNLGLLAAAYGVSSSAALIAEARVKAESKAIKDRGDIEAQVSREIRLVVAQRIADGEKTAEALRAQAGLQEGVNTAVAAGIVPAARAGELLKDRAALLPLVAAQEAAIRLGRVSDAAMAGKAILDLAAAQERDNAARRTGLALQANRAGEDELARLREEARLIGATEAQRVVALATLKATQEARNFNPEDQAGYVAGLVAIAKLTLDNRLKQDAYNASLTFTADQWDIIAGKVQSAASGMADAFGSAGRALGGLAAVYAGFTASRARADAEHSIALKNASGSETLIAQENAKFALRSSGAQIEAYGDMAAAAKGFFKEGSSGYKALAAAEKVYRVAQLAMSLQSMVQNALETTTHVAGAAVRATADGTAGIAKQSQLPFPANIAAMAATAAALVAAGVAVFGGRGGGQSTADFTKGNTGSGTVFGDPDAKSESIKRSIDALKNVDDTTLTVSRDMLVSLRSIDNSIGGLAKLLVKAGNIDASAGVNAGLQKNAIGSVLSSIPLIGGLLGGLFGTKTTVVGNGLYGKAQSVGSILDSGYDASYYSDVEKKKKFFGITTSTKLSTVYGAADAGIEDQFTLLIKSFYDTIGKAAGPLGKSLDEVQNRLLGFTVNIGKLDLKGLSGQEIADKLEAVFGAAADDMAAAAFPGIERFQKVGEGAFETLVRVSSTVEQVDAVFRRLGATSSTMGADVDMAIAGMFDSVSDFTSAADAYFQAFYTPAEQTAAKTDQMTRAFTSLGMIMPTTLTGFRNLVDAQDLTNDAGRATYATLLQLAPAFADLQKSMSGAKSAADILAESQDLQQKLWQLTGDTAAIRAAELAKLDPSNRALQQQIYAISDAQDAAKAAGALRDAWTSVGDSIMDEVKRIRGLTDAGGGGTFASLLGQFNAATAMARGGDQDQAKLLPQLSKDLLDAAAKAATSRQELDRVRGQTAASLEETYASIADLLNPSTAASAADMAASAAAGAATPASTSTADLVAQIVALRQEVTQLRTENNAGHTATATEAGKVARKMDDVTADSGGTAISTISRQAAG